MVKKFSLKTMARSIITENQYMTLGTANNDNQAWVSPVVYTYDRNHCLYFMSLPDSRHCKNIKNNAKLAAAIFDSHQKFGEGIGLQILGEAKIVTLKGSAGVFKLYFNRNWPYGDLSQVKTFKKIFKVFKYRFYKIILTEVWLNDPRKNYDTRVKVNLF